MTLLTPSTFLAAQNHSEANNVDMSHDESNRTKLCRSPHPYHRRGASLRNPRAGRDEEGQSNVRGSELSEANNSSESGTEADDERGRLLKGLPAPPRRPHKGLRDAPFEDTTPQSSPLGTPLPSESSNTQFAWPTYRRIDINLGDRASQLQSIREKYTKRKRLELVRRLTETVLFAIISFVVSYSHLSETWFLGRKSAIFCEISLVLLLYLLCPVRAAMRAKQAGYTFAVSFQRGFHIPSRFDVAPLLYPVFLPLLVSISLGPVSPGFIFPNIVLGLSSLPLEVVSSSSHSSDLNILHWLLTLLPIPLQQASKPSDSELMSLLYPLHVYTILTLQFLTTTSLDLAELRLLGTILIDIYYFAFSPQSEILKALLWFGSILLFVTCKKPLQWELALARIPAWRLRDSNRRRRSGSSVLQSLDRAMCNSLVRLANTHKVKQIDDSEEEVKAQPFSQSTRLTSALPTTVNGLVKQQMPDSLSRSSTSAIGAHTITPNPNLENVSLWDAKSVLYRRHTLAVTDSSRRPHTRTTPGGRPKRSLTPRSHSFRNLGSVQITVRKVLYAAFVYFAVLSIILGPIRTYIRFFSMGGHDPFGWAIGYLLGNILELRLGILSAGLEDWIPLPERSYPAFPGRGGWFERMRQHSIGPANVRLIICGYCVVVLLLGLGTVHKLSATAAVDTRRKVFHGMMVAMLLPTIYVDPCFISLALVLILALFLLLDLIRASQLPPISKPLTAFLAPYVDGRDHRGPVIVSHIFLLIGCAIPLWLTMAATPRSGRDPWNGWEIEVRDVSMVSGVVCVGMGDSAASLIGRRYGRHRWYWGGGKSLEGSMAFAAAVTTGLTMAHVWLRLGGWISDVQDSPAVILAKAGLAASGASLTESVLTGANDNVVVPVALWLLVRGLNL